MASDEDVKKAQTVEARARNISHNVRCTECGSQSIEDSQADVAILLRKLIRDEIRSGKSDKEIYEKIEDVYGETVLYAPHFDLQTAALWLSPSFAVHSCGSGHWCVGLSEAQKEDQCAHQGSESCKRSSFDTKRETDNARTPHTASCSPEQVVETLISSSSLHYVFHLRV